jgi:hypothetical protein
MISGLGAALVIPVLILLPGYSLLPAAYPKRMRLPFVVFTSVGISSAIALILMALGQFSPSLIALIEAPLLLIRVRTGRWPDLGLSHHLTVLAIFLLAAAFAVLSSGEPFDATGDSGVYTISALHLAETGGWTWPLDQVIPPGISLDLVSHEPQVVKPWREVAPGFVVRGQKVVPQFFPLYPIWGAVFASWLGMYGVLAANLLGALMILLGYDGLLRLLLGRRWRLAGLAAILLNPVFLIFLKYPSAEIFLTGILAGWMYWTVLFLRNPTAKGALVPGMLLALAILTKFFAFAIAGATLVFFALLPRRQLRAAALYLAVCAPALAVDAWLAGPHLENHLRQLMTLIGFEVIAIGCVAILGLRLIWAGVARWAQPGLAGLYVAGLLFLWFGSGMRHAHDFAALSGRLVVWFAAAGLVLYLWRRRPTWQLFPAFVFVLLTLYLFLGSGDSPYYPFAARRYLPITIPLGGLFISYLVASSVRSARRVVPTTGRSLAVVGCIALAAALLPPVFLQRDAVLVRQAAGFTATLAELEGAIPDDALVMATGEAWRYSPYLLLAGRPVFCADLRRPGRLAEIAQHLDRHPGTLALTNERGYGDSLAMIEELRPRIQITTHPPLTAAFRKTKFRLLDAMGESWSAPGVLDVGEGDHLRVSGFFPPERARGRSFRWTGRRARILVGSGERLRFVWSRGGNPRRPLRVKISVRGQLVGRAQLTGGWQTSRWYPIPDGDGAAVVEIRVPTYRPALNGAGKDRRALGLCLDLVETR